MLVKTLILISLFSYSFLIYFPLSQKKMDWNSDDMRSYYEDSGTDDVKIYVKPCDRGFYFTSFIKFYPNDYGIC